MCSLAETNRRKRRTAGYKRGARDRQWDRFLATTEETLIRHVVVEGFVQGVGYRDFARRAALRLGVSGWVRNRSDGTVEALMAGAPADVEAMLGEMRRGPRGAAVAHLRLIDPDSVDQAKAGAFVIRSTR